MNQYLYIDYIHYNHYIHHNVVHMNNMGYFSMTVISRYMQRVGSNELLAKRLDEFVKMVRIKAGTQEDKDIKIPKNDLKRIAQQIDEEIRN